MFAVLHCCNVMTVLSSSFDHLSLSLVSEAPKAAPVAPKYQSYEKVQTEEEKKEELIAAMITKMGDKDEEKLPQDDMEGVDSDEWVSLCVCLCVCVWCGGGCTSL